jgi:hypothetical protein
MGARVVNLVRSELVLRTTMLFLMIMGQSNMAPAHPCPTPGTSPITFAPEKVFVCRGHGYCQSSKYRIFASHNLGERLLGESL